MTLIIDEKDADRLIKIVGRADWELHTSLLKLEALEALTFEETGASEHTNTPINDPEAMKDRLEWISDESHSVALKLTERFVELRLLFAEAITIIKQVQAAERKGEPK